MSRFIFAALGSLCITAVAAAQRVPGRDLFEFPVGLLAEPAPLSSRMTGGFWNPATGALPGRERAAFGFAGLNSPQDQGVRLNLFAGAYKFMPKVTGLLSLASASVADILRTETDPQSHGPEIPYSSTLMSAGLATTTQNARYGLMLRYRRGTADTQRGGVFAIDGGFVLDRVAGTPLRIAASTFLFTPTSQDREATYFAAIDAPVVRRDSSFVLRIGHSIGRTNQRGRDEYTFLTSTYRQIDVSGGLSRNFVFGNHDNRWRLGAGLHYSAYTIAIGREDGAAGLGPSYQFLLKRVVE